MQTLIEPHPSAPEGKVEHLSSYVPSLFPPGSAILCRNTAPLIGMAYSLLERDIPCRILGKDIGAQLAGLVKKLRASDLTDLLKKLSSWSTREAERCIAQDKSPEWVFDQQSCITHFINSLDSLSQGIPDLLAKIDLMFGESKDVDPSRYVILSTVHKAKGLEYPRVFILDFSIYMPSRFAVQDWQKKQERNLIYVAQTRAILELFYISSDSWKETQP